MFVVSFSLQLRTPSGANSTNVFGYIIAILALFYLLFFMWFCFRGINRMGKIVGTKSMDAVPEWKNHFEEYKIKYEVLYFPLEHIYFFNRNFMFLQSVRNCCVSILIVAFHDFPMVCLSVLLTVFLVTGIFLVVQRPFVDTPVNYVYAVNEILLVVVLSIIMNIYVVLQKEGPYEISIITSN